MQTDSCYTQTNQKQHWKLHSTNQLLTFQENSSDNSHQKERNQMGKANSKSLFNTIAPIYNLFYNFQKRHYRHILEKAKRDLDLLSYDSLLDVGCGTGALCSVLHENGMTVTGIDPAQKMLMFAKSRQENDGIPFLQADVLQRLPFDDNSFDICFASYVAHGLQKEDRRRMYKQMSRVAKKLVVIHDYNRNRALLTSIVEWLEKGDYFHFIVHAEDEMKNCVSDMKECFSDVKVIDVGTRAAWYICTPKN